MATKTVLRLQSDKPARVTPETRDRLAEAEERIASADKVMERTRAEIAEIAEDEHEQIGEVWLEEVEATDGE